jgi:hypothetical protein
MAHGGEIGSENIPAIKAAHSLIEKSFLMLMALKTPAG